jgi:hypothetical protein
VLILILVLVWLTLLFLTFRPPDTPKITRLLFFLAFLAVTGFLVFQFAIVVLKWNPNPMKVNMAHRLMDDKFIDLIQVAPGVFDLKYINLVDTDVPSADDQEQSNPADQEWLAFYQYDVVDPAAKQPAGPYGAAIYGLVNCRPPSVLSYELASVAGGPLGEDAASAAVENIILYQDPLSVAAGVSLDRPEVIINGYSRSAVTDLNIFRKVGVQLDCLQLRQWAAAHPGQAFPNPIRFENIGSFHGSYVVKREAAIVTTLDRNTLERSQIAIQNKYQPQNGSYFQPGTQTLLPPVETGLVFTPGQPQEVTQTYYPEKAVLAFYLALGNDPAKLAEAKGYLSEAAQAQYDIDLNSFGVALPRSSLARVLVWEIGYRPDPQAEQLREPRPVQVSVVGVDASGLVDSSHPCRVTWRVIGVPNDKALPFGCEWRLDSYESSCAP